MKNCRCAHGDKGDVRHIWELLTEAGRSCPEEVRSPIHLKPKPKSVLSLQGPAWLTPVCLSSFSLAL